MRETNVQRMEMEEHVTKKGGGVKPSALRHPLYGVNLLLSSASGMVLVMKDFWQR